MAAHAKLRRHISADIARITRHHGPDDPRLDDLRARLDAAAAVDDAEAAIADLTSFVDRARAALLPFTSEQIAAVGRTAAALDGRSSDGEAA